MKQPNTTCTNCGAPLYRIAYRLWRSEQHFCNKACRDEWQTIEIECATCGTRFRRQRSRAERSEQNFCSGKCRDRWLTRRITVECANCRAPLSRRSSQADAYDRHFCNRKCQDEWRTRRVIVPCTNCGATLSRTPYALRMHKDTFCNARCQSEYRRKRIPTICTNCGTLVEKKPYQIAQSNLPFCGQKCTRAWLRGPNHPDWKGGAVNYRGPNWEQQAHRARERDGHCCQVCGISADELRLDVHHIVPFREFGYVRGENDHYLQANRLSNLITLCLACHPRVEVGLIPCPIPEDY